MDPTTKDVLTYAGCAVVFGVIAKSLGAGWIGAAAAGAGGLAVAAFVVQQQTGGSTASAATAPPATGALPSQLNPQLG